MQRLRTFFGLVLVMAMVIVFALPAMAGASPVFTGTVIGAATLDQPGQVATDYLGNVYIADYNNDRIQVFSAAGAFIRNIGSGDFNAIKGVAVDRWLYVYGVDVGGKVVRKYNVLGASFGTLAAGHLDIPRDVAADNFGMVYVADLGSDTIEKFNAFGGYEGSLGGGFLNNPTGVGVSQDGQSIFACNNAVPFGDVLKFSRSGTLLGTIASGLGNPIGLAVDADSNVWVAEENGLQRVVKFGPNGGPALDVIPDLITNGYGVGLDDSFVYVSDFVGDRVLKFTYNNVPHKTTARIGGGTRYDVAANLVAQRWPGYTGIKHVIIACGETRANADPLAAAGLAGVYDAPVLLTSTSKATAVTYNTIKAINGASGPVAIHVVGGTTSIPTAVYNKFKKANPGGTIERISGDDRYILAANIARRVKTVCDANGIIMPGVLIFNAENSKSFYDALAASPMSARGHLPMLAVRSKSVPPATLSALAESFAGKPRYVVSSSGYISDSVKTQVGSSFRFATTTNRAQTAQEIAFWARLNGWLLYTNVALANALPDALTGGSFVGLQDGVLMYTNKGSVPAQTTAFLTNPAWKHGTYRGWVLGGTASVSDAALAQFNAALNTP